MVIILPDVNLKIQLVFFILFGLTANACRAIETPSLTATLEVTASHAANSGKFLPAYPTSTLAVFQTPTAPSRASAMVLPTETNINPLAATQTQSPTLTPTIPHPLTIEYLRQMDFPGSAITIEETLKPGLSYDRYIASYYSEGLKIYALLTVPQGEKPASGWPVIIFNHGYIPPDQYRTTELYMDHVHDLAMHGYIVFRPDYRGHGNSEGVARGAYGSPDYTIDVLHALAAMKKYPAADPDRIAMWGHSMGGYITLRCMVASEDIKAGVIWAGVVASYPDLLSGWFRQARRTPTPASGQAGSWIWQLFNEFGSPEDNPLFWDSISANSYLGDLSGPVQLHHGTADESVPDEFSSRLARQIEDAGGSVEYYPYRGDDHNLTARYTQAMLRTIWFFDRYLKGMDVD